MDAPVIFDRKAVKAHRNRAARLQSSVMPILDAAADILLDRLSDVTRQFTHALDIGGRGVMAERLTAQDISVISSDLSPSMAACASGVALCADEEALPFAPHSFDLITANLSLHWINDLPGALTQVRQCLKPDGLFLASMPILPTLRPLRQALDDAELALSDGISPRVSPLPTQQSCAHLLQRAGFALPVVDTEKLDLRYRSLMALLQDLRAAGETNALALRSRTIPPRLLFPAAAAEINPDGAESFAMPLHMAILTAWAPAPTQQQPLKPGAFTHSLEAALTDTPPASSATSSGNTLR
ncbi:methyltransferase domain-containing protein [Acetobacter orleanensis]|uniref:SAM-dependent methyltransferase n=1 Tax=Acetobacter orleanensis TaxID=104099 RepID=A0A4Y3TIU6_9PROT|nr:methyltransferase domain-containing protein [Acetobacter orleanensis]KXV62017.1 methyltransferase [Acetobacter orleanensis]PCD80351.1 SAM-dependent methyltransferase [Acetobacter orleanensis]GAN68894.1 methyltransferase [Acetobacter orleanensis JCM 7639]GBR30816.1 methyltransferase [Acetobacter orleanensis NRIC 0473]GEB81698.1 SAM-dependent methyltransferase [Acetobacter orleanensis]